MTRTTREQHRQRRVVQLRLEMLEILSLDTDMFRNRFHLIDVEESFAIVLARGEGGVTALVPGRAPGAELGDPPPPA